VRGLAARHLPLGLALRVLGMRERSDLDSPAVVLFGRGTRSSPKGVVLSHWNVLSNLLSLREVFDVGPEDCILCPAPVWHGLGFLGGICLPILSGARASHPPDPFSAERVAKAAQESGATLLLATPVALALYARSVEPRAFASLTRVLTGGSPLLPEVRAQFADRFGPEPLEGYGCAECSLVISLNVPDFRDESRTVQRGTRAGTLGHPLPGVAVEICELQSDTPLVEEQLGRIRVRGPNVMLGYLSEEGLEHVSAEVDADGWFDTGDLGMLDRAGFLRVAGRAERMLGTAVQAADGAETAQLG
jgi:acyl-[acyl-carrier-protein]-phospholipid O-acyltransferase/long-chain-fatty-acid--[acyl-carrier-protein] ligase